MVLNLKHSAEARHSHCWCLIVTMYITILLYIGDPCCSMFTASFMSVSPYYIVWGYILVCIAEYFVNKLLSMHFIPNRLRVDFIKSRLSLYFISSQSCVWQLLCCSRFCGVFILAAP